MRVNLEFLQKIALLLTFYIFNIADCKSNYILIQKTLKNAFAPLNLPIWNMRAFRVNQCTNLNIRAKKLILEARCKAANNKVKKQS